MAKNTRATKVFHGSIDENFSVGLAKHEVNTEKCMELINYTSKAGIKGMPIEGWNTDWEYWGAIHLVFLIFKPRPAIWV